MNKKEEIQKSITELLEKNPEVKFHIVAGYKQDNSNYQMRVCEGFNIMELLGMTYSFQQSFLKQLEGKDSPIVVDKYFVEKDQTKNDI